MKQYHGLRQMWTAVCLLQTQIHFHSYCHTLWYHRMSLVPDTQNLTMGLCHYSSPLSQMNHPAQSLLLSIFHLLLYFLILQPPSQTYHLLFSSGSLFPCTFQLYCLRHPFRRLLLVAGCPASLYLDPRHLSPYVYSHRRRRMQAQKPYINKLSFSL